MIISNRQSPLQKALSEAGFSSPFGPKKEIINYGLGIKKMISEERIILEDNLYGQRRTLPLPRNKGHLAQIQIKFTITSIGDNTICEPFLAAYICKAIYLETMAGCRTIQRIYPEYTISRIDESTQERISFFSSSMAFDQDLTAASSANCYLTCFFYFSEYPELFLNTGFWEQLQLQFWTNDSYAKMGLSNEISKIVIEPIYTLFETDYDIVVPMPLVPFISHDISIEKPLDLVQGSTMSTLEIKSMRSVFAMHLQISNDNFEILSVKGFRLIANGKTIIEFNRQGQIELWSQNTSSDTENTLVYWFSLLKSRYDNSFLLNLYDLRPLILEVDHEQVPEAGYRLKCFFEYIVLNQLEFNGHLTRLNNY